MLVRFAVRMLRLRQQRALDPKPMSFHWRVQGLKQVQPHPELPRGGYTGRSNSGLQTSIKRVGTGTGHLHKLAKSMKHGAYT